MKTRAYIEASAVIFTLVALMHLLRLAQGWPVLIGTLSIPFWSSVLAILVTAGAAVWGFSLLRRTG